MARRFSGADERILGLLFAACAWCSGEAAQRGAGESIGFERVEPAGQAGAWRVNGKWELCSDAPHAGQQCLRFPRGGSVTRMIELEAGRLYRLSCFYKCPRVGASRGFVIEHTHEAGGPLRFWIDAKGIASRNCPFYGYALDWGLAQTFALGLKEGAVRATVSLRPLGGVQSFLLDDLSFEALEGDDAESLTTILDGGFENGGYGLIGAYAARAHLQTGDLIVEIDPTEFAEGRHSLKITRRGSDTLGAVNSNDFVLAAGTTYELSLWLKGHPQRDLVSLSLTHSFDQGGKWPYNSAQIKAAPTTNWRRYTLRVRVPGKHEEGYVRSLTVWRFTTQARGQGTLWLDDVHITPAAARARARIEHQN